MCCHSSTSRWLCSSGSRTSLKQRACARRRYSVSHPPSYPLRLPSASAPETVTDMFLVDPECDIAVATMAQLLLQQGKVTDALRYFERAAELARTEGELVNALSYAEATRTQIQVQEKYPQLASKLTGMAAMR
jgi:Tfp pilus assembly protein PilF